MRVMIAALGALALAGPAAAQVAPDLHRYNELWAEQQLIQQRALILETELGALEARVRTQDALQDLELQRRFLRLATPYEAAPQGSSADPGDFAQIPDDRLAASNARIRAAGQADR